MLFRSARHLLLCGAEVDAVVGGRGALHDSVAAPRPSCARLLLSFGADPNLLLPGGFAPVHLSAAGGAERGVRCLRLLLRYGGDPNAR